MEEHFATQKLVPGGTGVHAAFKQPGSAANDDGTPARPMSPTAFELLKIAVDLARERDIRRVDALRRALQRQFPSHEQDIDDALTAWSSYVARSRGAVP